MVLFIVLYKVTHTFEFVDEMLKCEDSNESYCAVLSCGAVYYALQGALMCSALILVHGLKNQLYSCAACFFRFVD